MREFATYRAFWEFYLSEHSKPLTRRLHFFGTTLVMACVIASIVTPLHWLIFVAPLCGYGFAWVGHFFVEHNRPATFKYPLRSFVSDFKLWWWMLTRKI